MVGASISTEAYSNVKRCPSRAHGTAACVIFPQSAQSTRGTSACRGDAYWKKSRWRQERTKWSCSGGASAPQAEQAKRAAPDWIWKSLRADSGLKVISSTCQQKKRGPELE